MKQHSKLLFDADYKLVRVDIDSIKYSDSIIEQPLSNIIDFDWKQILSPPRENSSKQTYKEILYIQDQTIAHRSDLAIQDILDIDNDPNFGIKKLLKERNLKFPLDYFNIFYSITRPIMINTKYLYNRARPKTIASLYGISINVLETETHHTPSYPSGHTFYTALAAKILEELYPNLKYELKQQVDNTANARIRQGVHYPSDNEGSLVLSNYVFNKLHPILQKEPQWTEFMKY